MPRLSTSTSEQAMKLLPTWSKMTSSSRLSRPVILIHLTFVFVVFLGSLGFRPSIIREVITRAVEPECTVHALDNPIAALYPNNATGTINGTLAVVPISMELARSIIPPQWRILERAYRALLPDFPEGMYPAIVQGVFDFDVQQKSLDFRMDDFQRIGFEFPFLDFLGDGHTSCRWAPVQLITATNEIAVNGSRDYGTLVHPANFDPPCNGYKQLANGATYLEGYSIEGEGGGEGGATTRVALEFQRLAVQSENPYPLDFWRNITNQPNFADGSLCGNMKRFFNTKLSRGQYEPVFVKGKVTSWAMGPFRGDSQWNDVYGVQLDTPFIETSYKTCDWMSGYSGFDEPDLE